MAKKSKIAKNNQRRVIVERYAEQRSALKEAIRSRKAHPRSARRPKRPCNVYHATPVRYDCAIETLRMDVRAATCGSSGSPGFACEKWRTVGNCLAYTSQAGKEVGWQSSVHRRRSHAP